MNQIAKLEPHARRLEDAANAMESDGIGGDLDRGHVVTLKKMAASLRAAGAQGRIPHVLDNTMYASAEPAIPSTTISILSQLGL